MAETFLEECVAILSRTPATLDALLRDLPDAWTLATEGEGTWSPSVDRLDAAGGYDFGAWREAAV